VIEIWLSDWSFYGKLSPKEKAKNTKPSVHVVKDVIVRRIPTRFILNENLSYRRATNHMMKTFLSTLEEDKETGLKKFTITFTKKIGEVNG
jgi:hypothetical protein